MWRALSDSISSVAMAEIRQRQRRDWRRDDVFGGHRLYLARRRKMMICMASMWYEIRTDVRSTQEALALHSPQLCAYPSTLYSAVRLRFGRCVT